MDYNDINSRLKRLYLSINQQYESDVLQHMQTKTEKNRDGKFTIVIDFKAKHDNDETINRINGIISNLANIKDHLKTKLKLQGGDPQDIENEIKKDLSLQLILDLNNEDKHGYPLAKINHSGKNPKIINITKALSQKPGVIATEFIGNPITGAGYTNNMAIVISAEVIDDQGNFIFYLNDLIKKSINSWESIINKYNLK